MSRPLRPRSKYGNKKVEYNGYLWDSIREKSYYQELCLRKKARDIIDFWIKPKVSVFLDEEMGLSWCWKVKPSPNSQLLFIYIPDFVIIDYEGNIQEIIDVKSEGTITDVFKLKRKILEALGVKIVLK